MEPLKIIALIAAVFGLAALLYRLWPSRPPRLELYCPYKKLSGEAKARAAQAYWKGRGKCL